MQYLFVLHTGNFNLISLGIWCIRNWRITKKALHPMHFTHPPCLYASTRLPFSSTNRVVVILRLHHVIISYGVIQINIIHPFSTSLVPPSRHHWMHHCQPVAPSISLPKYSSPCYTSKNTLLIERFELWANYKSLLNSLLWLHLGVEH